MSTNTPGPYDRIMDLAGIPIELREEFVAAALLDENTVAEPDTSIELPVDTDADIDAEILRLLGRLS